MHHLQDTHSPSGKQMPCYSGAHQCGLQAVSQGDVTRVGFIAQSQFFLLPSCRSLCRQRSVGVGEHLQGGGGADTAACTDPACSTSWSKATDASSSCSSCAPALQLLPSTCCCLQTCSGSVCACASLLAPGTRSQAHSGPFCSCLSCAQRKAGDAAPHGSTSVQGVVASSWGWDLPQEIQAWFWAMGEGCPNFRSPFLMLSNPSSGVRGGGMDTKVQGYCCTGACLQALCPSVLPASQSCLQLCS